MQLGFVGEPVAFGVEADADDAEEALAVGLADVDAPALAGERATATASAGSSGMPSTRARSLPRPPGTMPSGVSEPAIAPPTAPTRPSPLITTGTSPASTARSACSTPCSRPLVRSTRKRTRRASSACSTWGSSFSVLPPGRGRVDQQRQRHSLDLHAARSLVAGARSNRRRAGGRQRSCRRRPGSPRTSSIPRRAQAPAQQSRRPAPAGTVASGPGSGGRRGAAPARSRAAGGRPSTWATRSKKSSG